MAARSALRALRWGAGGLIASAKWLRRRLREVDLLWVNHAVLGRWVVGSTPAIYDVTDDWRLARNSARNRRRLIRAEDWLAQHARTIVCSEELARRWKDRYGVDAVVVRNGVNVEAIRTARPVSLDGVPPHLGYIGTLQRERVDVGLVEELARDITGTVHLVGPDHLDAASRQRLTARPNIRIHGPVPATEVPSWLAAMDVLLVPHAVSPFTLSLDAIKAHEYLATDRPVVATPSSGFQDIEQPGLRVVPAGEFVAAVRAALEGPSTFAGRTVVDWDERAREFATAAWGP